MRSNINKLVYFGIDYSFSKSMTMVTIPKGVGCGHAGCLNHISHPCEYCGRKNGKGIANIMVNVGEKI